MKKKYYVVTHVNGKPAEPRVCEGWEEFRSMTARGLRPTHWRAFASRELAQRFALCGMAWAGGCGASLRRPPKAVAIIH